MAKSRTPHDVRKDAPLSSPQPPPGQPLLVIHYSQELPENSTGGTPPVSAIIVSHLPGRQHQPFAAHLVAEERGVRPGKFLSLLPGLEEEMLRRFYVFLRENRERWWMHWGMRKADFGFQALAQRARRYGIEPVDIPVERLFDLAEHLKEVYGDDFAPHPRFGNALALNGFSRPDLLDKEAAQAAWRRGEYARLLTSLSCKVDGIADMWRLTVLGEFKTATPAKPATKKAGPGREARIDPKAEERDAWLYKQCKSRTPQKPYKAIRSELAAIAKSSGWEPLESDQAVHQAVKRYVRRHDLKPLPPRKDKPLKG